MDSRRLKELIGLAEESSIAEVEVTEGGEKICITRATAAQPVFVVPVVITSIAVAPVAAASAPAVSAALAARSLSNI